jgi:hypothetical protein
VCFILLTGTRTQAQKPKTLPGLVRVVYFVPKDRKVRADYKKAIEDCALELQEWFYLHLKGKTFLLNSPVVEVYRAARPAAFYSDSRPEGRRDLERKDFSFWNTFEEAKRALGARQGDRRYVWLIYIDSPPGWGEGLEGVCVMPDGDLKGLLGKNKEDLRVARWVGGAGHEFGHALGLPHPPDGYDIHSIMDPASGLRSYPLSYFALADRRRLLKSPFIKERKPLRRSGDAVMYEGGFFVQVQGKKWEERRTDSTGVLFFEETQRDDNFIIIYDASRRVSVKLPRTDGQSFLKFDGEKWRKLYDVRR